MYVTFLHNFINVQYQPIKHNEKHRESEKKISLTNTK